MCLVNPLVGGPAAWAQTGGQTPAPTTVSGEGRIEALLKDGWEVAGYVAASDIRTLILFRHKANAWLVQCSVLIDVTRSPRQIVNCYEVR